MGQDEETVRRLRPLARRRFSTSRPFFVAMRVRKPCVFLRRRRLGWNVRFMIQTTSMRISFLAEKPKYYRRIRQTVNEAGRPDRHIGVGRSVCYSPIPCDVRRVSPRSFPQLWKKMWKSLGFAPGPARASRKHVAAKRKSVFLLRKYRDSARVVKNSPADPHTLRRRVTS